MEQNNHPAAAAATVDHDGHAGLLQDLLMRIAPCFARRETRLTCADMVRGLLMELEDHNCWTSWHRWTAFSLLACAFLAIAAIRQRARDGDLTTLALIPVTVPELLRQLRDTVIPAPRRDQAHRQAWTLWRRRHQYQAQQAHKRWHIYADTPPRP